jgi:hypothetical protein
MKTFLIHAAIVATVGLLFVGGKGVAGSPVSDEVAAAIVGGCNGATSGTQSCTSGPAGCVGSCLVVPSNGNTNASGTNGPACLSPPSSCVNLPTTNPAGCSK